MLGNLEQAEKTEVTVEPQVRTSSRSRIDGLDSVRAAAIVLVLIAHSTSLFPLSAILNTFVTNLGSVGVDLFFVLSGYLIGGILISHSLRAGLALPAIYAFWRRRWYRTLPNHLVCLIIVTLFVRTAHLTEFYDSAWRNGLFIRNFTTNYIGVIYAPSWSLAIEEWMYLLVPALAALMVLHRRTSTRFAVAATISIMCILPAALRGALGYHVSFGVIEWGVVFRLDSIGFGLILAYLSRFHKGLFESLSRPGVVALCAMVAFGCYWSAAATHWFADPKYSTMPWSLWSNVMSLTLLPAGLAPIVARSAAIAEIRNRTLQRASLNLSRYSYSLYLWHWSVLIIIDRYASTTPWLMWRPARAGATLVIIGALSFASYRIVELPFMKLRDRQAGEFALRKALR